MRSRSAHISLAFIASLLVAGLAPVVASATKVEDLRAEARRLTAAINANGDRIAALGERYDGAVLHLQQVQQQQRQTAYAVAIATRRAASLRTQKAHVAAQLYMSAGTPDATGTLQPSSASVLATAASTEYSQSIASHNSQLIAGYLTARSNLVAAQQRLAGLAASAKRQVAELATTRHQIEAANEQERQLLAKVNGQLGQLIAQEQARQQRQALAAARARAAAAARAASQPQAAVTSSGASQGPATNLPNVPPPSSGAAAAIAFARAQIGKPYVWGTTGPDTYDCSGLTMRAWEAGGVSMPHYSGAQFAAFPHVGLNQLQPGDLVFKGPGGSEHVALYVGGGMQIAATHTGSFVLLQPVDYGGLSGAVRP